MKETPLDRFKGMSLGEFLNWFDFDYDFEYDEQGKKVYGLIDLQGAYLGGIGADRFKSVKEIVDRLDTYYLDYLVENIEDDYEFEWETYEDILKWLNENVPTHYAIPYFACIVNPDLLYEERYYVADKETGTFIESVLSIDEGKKKIKGFEMLDKMESNYTPDFYDIVDEHHCSVL